VRELVEPTGCNGAGAEPPASEGGVEEEEEEEAEDDCAKDARGSSTPFRSCCPGLVSNSS